MFNITVINFKKTMKKIFMIFFIILLIFFLLLKFSKIYNNIFNLINNQYKKILADEISFSNYEKIGVDNGLQKILSSELIAISEVEDEQNVDNTENIEVNAEAVEENQEENNIEETSETQNEEINNDSAELNGSIDYKTLKTSVVSEKNLKESYNAEYNGVKIKNESNFTLTQDMLKPDVEYTNKKDILIFHTHTCESYTQTSENSYKESGNYRTTDLNYSVAKVGSELTTCLVDKGYNVIHDTTYHDYPAYTGSYSRSLITVQNILKSNNGIQTVIDLHRDALGSNSDYGPTVMIGEEKVAQIMFVIGTSGGGLEHPNWNTNLKYAVKIQEKANEMFPGLFRPIIVRNSRYNQNLSSGACIIEVGATGNTLEECIGSMKYLAEVISEVMK